MINLRNVYGNKIFDRKASYRNSRYIPFLGSLLLDFLLAWVIIHIFRVDWDYAFVKVYGLLLLFGVLKEKTMGSSLVLQHFLCSTYDPTYMH